jgi:hypothetical protein
VWTDTTLAFLVLAGNMTIPSLTKLSIPRDRSFFVFFGFFPASHRDAMAGGFYGVTHVKQRASCCNPGRKFL